VSLDKRSRRRTVRAAERVSEATRSKSAARDRAVIQAMLREMDQLLAEMDQNQAEHERKRAEIDRLGARTDANLRAIRELLDWLRRTSSEDEDHASERTE
jgi:predicted component of type VI protein secretion system